MKVFRQKNHRIRILKIDLRELKLQTSSNTVDKLEGGEVRLTKEKPIKSPSSPLVSAFPFSLHTPPRAALPNHLLGAAPATTNSPSNRRGKCKGTNEEEKEGMASCGRGLNPPKTLNNLSSSSINNHKFPSISHLQLVPTPRNFPRIYAMSSQQPSLLDSSLASGERRDEVMGAVKGSLSNCLSETNLHLTVPSLKSKTRGKVVPFILFQLP